MSFIQNLFTSRDNGANAETYIGQQGRLWWDPETNKFYYSDGITPGGIPVGGGGGGNGTPGGSNTQVQFNNAGNFGGSSSFTFDTVTNTLAVTGNITAGNISGNISGFTQVPFSSSNTTVAITTVPAGKTITEISVIVFTPFNDPTATVSVGTVANTQLFVQTTDSNLSEGGTYTVPPGYYAASNTAVQLTVTSGTSSVGNGLLTLNYR